MLHRPRRSIISSLIGLTASIAAALVLAPCEAEAGGDDMWGTRGGEQMVEREHDITLSFERGYATMVVRRTIHNNFDRHDEAAYRLLIPEAAVAINLRTLGERRGKPHWYAADLLEAPLAAARYCELTGMDPLQPKPKDPALLAWDWQGQLMLQVFPVAPGSDKTIEYTLDMPAVWMDGRWVIWLEAMGLAEQPAELVIEASNAGDRLFVDEQAVEQGHRLTLDMPSHTLELVPREHAPVELELASLDTGRDRALLHWRVTVAPELSEVPKAARVVVALDLSRSLDDDELEAQRSAALAYLDHFRAADRSAEVAVFGFDHAIRALTDGFVSADVASGALRGASLEQRNGSAVDLALAEAGRLLGSAPKRAPRRVLLMTDFLTASSRSLAQLEQLADSTNAIVHLAELTADGPALIRDDQHAWASIAARTEGVVWQAAAPIDDDPHARQLAVEVFEEWARPIRLDDLRFEIDEPTWWAMELDEGEGHEELLLTDAVVDRLTVTGLLWNHPFEHEARRSRSLSKRWAALVFGSPLFYRLDPQEMLRLASHGGAVSPVTSYLAIEPGARPSAEGLTERELNRGLVGKGGGGGTGRGRGSRRSAGFGGRLDRQAWLNEQLNAAWLHCGGAGLRGVLTLEATYEELVDFVLTPIDPVDAALTTCMGERTWALLLPASDFIEDRLTWTIDLRA